MGTLKTLSIRQPWAWLIVNGHKDIENRSWPTSIRERIQVHAAKGMTQEEYDAAAMLALEQGVFLPEPRELERGGIVGEIDIVDCVSESSSPWFFGPFGFKLANPTKTKFAPCTGRLGFFRADP